MTTARQPYYPVLHVMIEDVVSFFLRSLRKYRAARELDSLATGEISAIARDLGVTQPQLKLLAGQDAGFPKLLRGMMAAVGISDRKFQEANPILARDMQTICALCGNKRRCSRELRAGEAGRNFRSFCPNSENFDALRVGPQ